MLNTKVRKRDAARTRQEILRAAQSVFSARTYPEARLQEITDMAGVSVALVSRYYGSKEELFRDALDAALDPRLLTAYDKTQFGRQVVQYFVGANTGQINPLPMLIHSTADPAARNIAIELLQQRIIEPLTTWFGRPGGAERAAQFVVVATGFFTYRLLLPLPPLQGALSDSMRRWLERTLQAIVDGPR
jgi:AcrR family transcriptional regulator